VDWDDAWMLETGGDHGLAYEARLAGVVAGDQLFDGDVAAELEVVCARNTT